MPSASPPRWSSWRVAVAVRATAVAGGRAQAAPSSPPPPPPHGHGTRPGRRSSTSPLVHTCHRPGASSGGFWGPTRPRRRGRSHPLLPGHRPVVWRLCGGGVRLISAAHRWPFGASAVGRSKGASRGDEEDWDRIRSQRTGGRMCARAVCAPPLTRFHSKMQGGSGSGATVGGDWVGGRSG